LTQINEANYEKTKPQTEKFTVSEIIQIIDRLSYYATQIKDTTNKYLWLELCIIDLTNYKNLPSTENLLNRIEELENKLSSGDFNVVVAKTTVVNKPIENVVQPKNVEIVQNVKPVSMQKVEQPKKDVEKEISHTEEEAVEKPQQNSNSSDMHSLWVSILQCIDSPPNRAFYSNLARPVEISQNKVVVAFSKEMFVKQAKEGAKKQALSDAVSQYLNVKNPNIEIITSDNIDLSKKVAPVSSPIKKNEEEQDLRKQEEEEYHSFVEAQKKEQEKPKVPNIDTSSQASMVKELFDGKIIS
jgi:hypothetical protein